MKKSDILLVVLLCMNFANLFVVCKLLFPVIKWNMYIPDELKLKTIVGISLRKCAVECCKRGSCEYIGYLRYANLCQLYTDFNTTFGQEGGHYLVIRIGDIDSSVFPGDCSCDGRQVCNAGRCEYEECPQLSVTNGAARGNTNDVGGRLRIQCKPGYTEANNIRSVVCGASGRWSYIPSCISITVCDDITIENGELIGKGNRVGALRTIACNQGYEESSGESIIECENSGVWNYLPVCDIVCPSAIGYSRNGFHIKIITNEYKNHEDAQNECSLSSGNLVKIDKSWKMDFINEILTSCSEYSSHNDYWTDGKCTNGLYKFADNTLVPMTEDVFWLEYRPSNYYEGSCVRLQINDGIYVWNDKSGTYKYRFICEF